MARAIYVGEDGGQGGGGRGAFNEKWAGVRGQKGGGQKGQKGGGRGQKIWIVGETEKKREEKMGGGRGVGPRG